MLAWHTRGKGCCAKPARRNPGKESTCNPSVYEAAQHPLPKMVQYIPRWYLEPLCNVKIVLARLHISIGIVCIPCNQIDEHIGGTAELYR